MKELQTEYASQATKKAARVYHFGSQGPGGVFSNHTSHSNRLVAVYLFGSKGDLGTVTGANSRYRDPDRVKELYGYIPTHTVNREAEYADQSDLYRVLKGAVGRGVKNVFIVWFDGLDWPTTQAAAIVKTGKVYTGGKGSGLVFQDYTGAGPAQYGFVVTSPTRDKSNRDDNAQRVSFPPDSLRGGYDARIAGQNPWMLGPLGPKAPGYIKGQSASEADRAGVLDVGGVLHAYTDSSQSAAEIVSGVKSFNSGLNIADDNRVIPTLFHELQGQGWRVGTVTSVPFPHASPAGMYAQDVERDDYQDLARAMFGLPGILQQSRNAPLAPGLDVVMGTGFGIPTNPSSLAIQGKNGVPGKLFLTDADRATIDVKNGGKYVVVETELGVNGGESLRKAAAAAVAGGSRLFGYFGTEKLDHLPYRTADGRFDPAPGLDRKGGPEPAEEYAPNVIESQPTLAQMTESALTVLPRSERPFILFVEAGDVDFALHSNNLDNAVGAILSGEEAVRTIIGWVESHSNWDDSLLLVSSDHGHYLVLDDPQALVKAR